MTRLSIASAALVALLLLHVTDHALRQETAVPGALSAFGLAGTAVAIAVLALALARHRLAPAAAVALGAGTALGFVAGHVVPEWSASLSLPYPEIGVDALSWAVVGAAIAVALWLAFEGARARHRIARPASALAES